MPYRFPPPSELFLFNCVIIYIPWPVSVLISTLFVTVQMKNGQITSYLYFDLGQLFGPVEDSTKLLPLRIDRALDDVALHFLPGALDDAVRVHRFKQKIKGKSENTHFARGTITVWLLLPILTG